MPTCERCSAPYVPTRADRRYCSARCQQTAWHERQPVPAATRYYAPTKTANARARTDLRETGVVCFGCGERHSRLVGNNARFAKYCSKKCQQAAWVARNKERVKSHKKQWFDKSGDAGKRKRREYKLRSKYSIGLAEYEALYTAQNGCCAICGSPDSGKCHGNGRGAFSEAWSVDHDHKTGRVRGLLCDHCNKGLGCFKDSPTVMLQAIEYLERNHGH